MLGRFNDSGGVAVADGVKRNLGRISSRNAFSISAAEDLGTTSPDCGAFPDAEVIAVRNVGAPMRAYGLCARYNRGHRNVTFVRMTLRNLSPLKKRSFDDYSRQCSARDQLKTYKILKKPGACSKTAGSVLQCRAPQYDDT